MKFDHITDEAVALITDVNDEMAALSPGQMASPFVKAVSALVHDHIGAGKPVDLPSAAEPEPEPKPRAVVGRVRGNLITISRETE